MPLFDLPTDILDHLLQYAGGWKIKMLLDSSIGNQSRRKIYHRFLCQTIFEISFNNECRTSLIIDSSLLRIAECCSALKNLDLSSCINITDVSVVRIVEFCSALKSLDLGYCRNITNVSVFRAAECCSALMLLNLTDNRNITNVSVVRVAECCSSLTSLNLVVALK